MFFTLQKLFYLFSGFDKNKILTISYNEWIMEYTQKTCEEKLKNKTKNLRSF